MRLPASFLALVLLATLLQPAPSRASVSSPSGQLGLVAEEAEGEGKAEGEPTTEGGGWVAAIATVGSGCLFAAAPTVLSFALSPLCCGVPTACVCTPIAAGTGAIVGAGIESGFDGGELFKAALWGGGVGVGAGLLASGLGMVGALVAGGAAGVANPPRNTSLNDPTMLVNTQVAGVIAGIVGGVTIGLGMIGAGVAVGLAYGSGDEQAEAPSELVVEDEGEDETAPAPTPVEPPKMTPAEPPVVEEKPAPAEKQEDDPEMKGFYY